MPAADRAKKVRRSRPSSKTCSTTPRSISPRSAAIRREILSDGLSTAREHLDTFQVDGQNLELQLERVELRPGYKVWLVASDSLPLIPIAHQLVEETAFEKKLPQALVTFEILDTPVWRWIALILMALVLAVVTRFLAWGLVAAVRPVLEAPALRGPLRVLLAAAGFRGALELASPATLSRVFIERALAMMFALGLAWAGAAVVDLLAERWRLRLDPRVHGVSYSVLPLGRQVLKLSLFLFAILGVLSAWGYNTTTILAGLGVGGLAVALAAQKTIENLFGGISVIGDRPVLVGDVCRFGDQTGTVMHIGLRSTRIRTADRTIISIPNGQFSSMALENISEPRQDPVSPDSQPAPRYDIGPTARGTLVGARNSEGPSKGGDRQPSRPFHRRRTVFAGCGGGRVHQHRRLRRISRAPAGTPPARCYRRWKNRGPRWRCLCRRASNCSGPRKGDPRRLPPRLWGGRSCRPPARALPKAGDKIACPTFCEAQ